MSSRANYLPTLLVNGNQEKFQLDSGSTVNIMTDETVLKLCGQDGLSKLECPHCPQRTSKAQTGQIVKYWSDSEGQYTHELNFITCGYNKESKETYG